MVRVPRTFDDHVSWVVRDLAVKHFPPQASSWYEFSRRPTTLRETRSRAGRGEGIFSICDECRDM